ncbi:MAG: hypothetical protein OXK76_06345 [Gammaproteobacteria bacterium]|nr:hypothetical protein [Gammaproteobacteria bacterium]
MSVAGFDHAAIPIANVEAMLRFYGELGFDVKEVQPPLFYSVVFGANKINFHGPGAWRSPKFTLRGPTAEPGCGDFCFVWDAAAVELAEMLARLDVPVVEGPVDRVGGRGQTGRSTYIRDPDGNLLEFIVYPG